MGYNTTVVVMNDAFDSIENDKDFGKSLVAAAHEYTARRKRCDIMSGPHVNAASVINIAHSSTTVLCAVGGNYGSIIGSVHTHSHHEKDEQLEILKAVASGFGYKLVKK